MYTHYELCRLSGNNTAWKKPGKPQAYPGATTAANIASFFRPVRDNNTLTAL
jgi:hypothetical protein